MSHYAHSRHSSDAGRSPYTGHAYVPSNVPSNRSYAQPSPYAASQRSLSHSRVAYPTVPSHPASYHPSPESAHRRHNSASGTQYYYATAPSGHSHRSHRTQHSGTTHRRSGSHSRTPPQVYTVPHDTHTRGRRESATRRSSSSGPYIDARSRRYPSVQVLPADRHHVPRSSSIERYNNSPTFSDKMRKLFGLGPPAENEHRGRSQSRGYYGDPNRGRSASHTRQKGYEHRDPGRGGIYTV